MKEETDWVLALRVMRDVEQEFFKAGLGLGGRAQECFLHTVEMCFRVGCPVSREDALQALEKARQFAREQGRRLSYWQVSASLQEIKTTSQGGEDTAWDDYVKTLSPEMRKKIGAE